MARSSPKLSKTINVKSGCLCFRLPSPPPLPVLRSACGGVGYRKSVALAGTCRVCPSPPRHGESSAPCVACGHVWVFKRCPLLSFDRCIKLPPPLHRRARGGAPGPADMQVRVGATYPYTAHSPHDPSEHDKFEYKERWSTESVLRKPNSFCGGSVSSPPLSPRRASRLTFRVLPNASSNQRRGHTFLSYVTTCRPPTLHTKPSRCFPPLLCLCLLYKQLVPRTGGIIGQRKPSPSASPRMGWSTTIA